MRKVLIFTLSCLYTLTALSQGKDIVVGQQYHITSKILKEERQIAIFMPKINSPGMAKYQVLYVLDGEWNFQFVAALVDKLISSGDIPAMIVVGIINTNRSKDLTPPGTNDNKNRYGGAASFLKFLTEELQPWIQDKFDTYPYQILAGHSFGGLFTIFSMINSPQAFQSYIALSPSLGRNDEQQISRMKVYLSSKGKLPNDLYIAVGNEGGATYHSTRKFVDLLSNKVDENFRLKFDHLEQESHVSITTQGFIEGLKFIYADFNPDKKQGLDEIFQIEAHYQHLSEKFGYSVKVPEEYYQRFVKEQIGERELDYALYILGKYEEVYPNSKQLLLYYADTYLLKGELDKAKAYFSKLKLKGFDNEHINALINKLN